MGTPINIDLTRDILFSDLAQDNWIPPPLTDALDIIAFHQGLHGYERTPLRPLPGVASLLGVRAVYLKDETERFGLPSFKFLGVSWATFRILCKRLGLPTSADVATMRRALGGAACVMDDGYGTINAATPGYSNGAYDRVRVTPRDQDPDRVTLVAATDGHHGRVVARIARLLGVPAQIFVASGSPWDAYDGLWREHAVVTDVDGDYNAVAAAARRFARDHADNAVLIEHDASPGQEAMPEWIMDGYSTIFFEITAQLAAQGHWTPPDLVLVPVGVGGLARAAVRHFKQPFYPVSLPGLPHTHVAPRPCQRAQPCPSQRILDEEQHLYSSSSHPTAVSHATRRPYPTFIVSVEPVSAASLMRAIALDDDGRGLVVAETLLPEGSGGGQEGDYVSVPRHRLAPLLERLDMLDRYGKSDNDSGAAEQQPMQWWPPHRHQQEQQPTSPLSPLLSPRSEPQTSPLALALQSSQQSSSVLQSLRPPLQQPRQQNKHKPAVTDGFGYKLVSEWAWDPWLRRGIDAALAVTDAEVDAAVRMLRDDLGISVGPCGAAALAGLVSRVAPLITASEAEICYATGGMRRRSAAEVRAALGLDEDAVIVLISTATYGATNAQDESGWDM